MKNSHKIRHIKEGVIKVPPIKCQGIKTKLVKFIMDSVEFSGEGRWIEPFVGSGVVVLNVAPKKALLTDINKHVIQFYKDLSNSKITPDKVRKFLEEEGSHLNKYGEDYYYEVRKRFNKEPSSLDFLFLNRSCFNGMIRFNSRGEFNVPSGRKRDRFRKAYITKIVNQVDYLFNLIKNRDWEFEVADWRDTLKEAKEGDFIYADPPYIGRHTDYYNKWTEIDAVELFSSLNSLSCGFALSTWSHNKYRSNPYMPNEASEIIIKTFSHFYHLGPTEKLRNAMEEALIIKNGFESKNDKIDMPRQYELAIGTK